LARTFEEFLPTAQRLAPSVFSGLVGEASKLLQGVYKPGQIQPPQQSLRQALMARYSDVPPGSMSGKQLQEQLLAQSAVPKVAGIFQNPFARFIRNQARQFEFDSPTGNFLPFGLELIKKMRAAPEDAYKPEYAGTR
jgi:hypothetical protein